MASNDIFNKPHYATKRPITADMIQLQWYTSGGTAVSIVQANNFQAQYQQQVQRRYTLNSAQNVATIYPSRPTGSITIGRLMCDGEQNIFTLGGFDVCNEPGVISWGAVGDVSSTGGCNTSMGGTYTARGCWVTSYGFQADADSLVVLDNVTIEFLQLEFVTTGE